jgi:hypothetical protein
MAEFTYNNHVHASTKHTPFFSITSCHPCMGFNPVEHSSNIEVVNNFVDHMKDTLSKAHAVLVKPKDDVAHYYNHHWEPPPTFTIGDKVFLDSLDINTTCPLKKLSLCNMGPFPTCWYACLSSLTSSLNVLTSSGLPCHQTSASSI